jgi:anti-anti-sigma factor
MRPWISRSRPIGYRFDDLLKGAVLVMKPHLTSSSSTITRHAGNQDGTAEVLAHPVGIGDRARRAEVVHAARPHLMLASAPAWRHKLILTGRLDCSTVVELEDEIECLCEEGVTILILDLRKLDALDSVGARAIAFRGAACKKRGRDFAVVPGSPVVNRALAEAGAESLLAGDPGEAGVLSLAASASDSSPRDTATVMIKDL